MRPLVQEMRDLLGEKKSKPGSGKRFNTLVKSLKKRDDVEDPEALAASIGREKYGTKKFAKMALAARKRRTKKK